MVTYDEHPPVLRCSGDEDRNTQSRRRREFSRALRAPCDLIVDLTGLAFADPSLMLDLAMLARRLRQTGSVMLLRGAAPEIRKLIEYVGLHRLSGVTLEPAPA